MVSVEDATSIIGSDAAVDGGDYGLARSSHSIDGKKPGAGAQSHGGRGGGGGGGSNGSVDAVKELLRARFGHIGEAFVFFGVGPDNTVGMRQLSAGLKSLGADPSQVIDRFRV